jgi:hypothetical protein
VFNGNLLLASGDVRSTLNGTLRAPGPGLWGQSFGSERSPLMGGSNWYRWYSAGSCCPDCECAALFDPVVDGTFLEGDNAATSSRSFVWGPVDGEYFSPPRASEGLLLSDGSALYASGSPADAGFALRAIDATGAERFACDIPPVGPGSLYERSLRGATALTDGRWAVLERDECPSCVHDPAPVLRVFEAKGISLAPSGWVGPGGTPGRTGSPR